MSNIVSLRLDEGLNDIDGFISSEKTDLDSVWSESGMRLRVSSLSNFNLCLITLVGWIPCGFNLIQRWFFKPELSPFVQSEFLNVVMLLHFSNEINQSGI